jgi:hypothetical protein
VTGHRQVAGTYRPTGLPGAEPALPLGDEGLPQLLPVTATAATAAALWLLIASPSPLSRYALGSGLGEGYLCMHTCMTQK